jgi:hypothetical protein
LILVFWPIIVSSQLPLPGVAVAIFLLLAAEICESSYLYLQRSRLLETRGLVPLGAEPVECKGGNT